MGVSGEDTGNNDLKLFDRQNFELAEWEQWNVGAVKKYGKVMLGFRRRVFGVVHKTTGYMMSPDDAIKMGEALISLGVDAKSEALMEKGEELGRTVIQ